MDWYSFCLAKYRELNKLKFTMKNILAIAILGTLMMMTSCQKETIEISSNSTIPEIIDNNLPPTNDIPSVYPNTNTVKNVVASNNTPSDLSLLQYIKGQSDCSIFYQALLRTGVEIDINGDGPFTLFVPTDAAFQTFLANNNWNSLDDISQNILTMIVKFHISNIQVKINDLEASTLVPLYLTEKEVYINMDDPMNPFVVLGLTSAKFTDRDLEQKNGVVHKIDAVLSL